MTATYYEERLRAFADGKRLGRLAKAVRDPVDGVCDACGSPCRGPSSASGTL